jgi:hypothetical protein
MNAPFASVNGDTQCNLCGFEGDASKEVIGNGE